MTKSLLLHVVISSWIRKNQFCQHSEWFDDVQINACMPPMRNQFPTIGDFFLAAVDRILEF